MTTAVGYASSSNTGIHFGTGTAAVIDRLEIRWPSGTVQTLTNVPRDSAIVVEEP